MSSLILYNQPGCTHIYIYIVCANLFFAFAMQQSSGVSVYIISTPDY